MSELLPHSPHLTQVEVDDALTRIARQHLAAGGRGMRVLNLLGGQAEGLIDSLPQPVRDGLTTASEQALALALKGAGQSRRLLPDQSPRINRVISTAMGAAGGAGSLPGALIELPATTAFLLRSIQGAAARQGFDPNSESTRFDCITVFSNAGPFAHDDGANTSFMSLRLTLGGKTLAQLLQSVAPKLGVAFGQKLAAQSVPVLGAMAGATTNYIYSGYYQDMADVHFGLRRLAIEADEPQEIMLTRLEQRMDQLGRPSRDGD